MIIAMLSFTPIPPLLICNQAYTVPSPDRHHLRDYANKVIPTYLFISVPRRFAVEIVEINNHFYVLQKDLQK